MIDLFDYLRNKDFEKIKVLTTTHLHTKKEGKRGIIDLENLKYVIIQFK